MNTRSLLLNPTAIPYLITRRGIPRILCPGGARIGPDCSEHHVFDLLYSSKCRGESPCSTVRSQIAESEWEHIDFKKATWHFPKPKGGTERAYTVPVSKYLLGRLQGRREQNHELYPGSKWVFPSEKSRSKHLSIPRNDKQGLPLAHALRHTYRTHSLIAGVSDIESHLLMNHKPDGVNYDYISRTVTIEHLRGAQEKITSHFLKHFGSASQREDPTG